jgi:uncharacterized protein (TIGR00369 family)
MDKTAFFWKMQAGELPIPAAVKTLGGEIQAVDPEQGTIETSFMGKAEFTNPTGSIQGGFIAAMLDDTMGPALAATLKAGEFAPTLTLTIQYMSQASVGKLTGRGRIVRRGKNVCYLAGELFQDERLIATATAVALIRAF